MASELGPENLVDVDSSPHKLLLPRPGQDPHLLLIGGEIFVPEVATEG